MLEQLKVEIVRDCVGSGVSPEVDRAVKEIKSIESGRRGSKTDIDGKLDVQSLFRELSVRYSFLRRLEMRDELKLLAGMASQNDAKGLVRAISEMARLDRNLLGPAKTGS